MKLKNATLELVPSDPLLAPQVAAYYCRNREFLREYEPLREDCFYTVEYQRQLLDAEVKEREADRSYRFYICLAGEPERIIGVIGLNNLVRGAFQSAFLGYKLDGACCGMGYMTQAVEMLTAYAFEQLKLHRIEGNIMPRNQASRRVLEKNGFISEGISRHYLKINGIWEDHEHMVKLNLTMHHDQNN